MDKKTIGLLVDKCYRDAGEKCTVILSDKLKDLGFFYATLGGISILHRRHEGAGKEETAH
ncbi:MAG: hypothetical protein MZU95_06150 [Desulfomicrobium escambiense]|nr:hypothetical protein [Desulfomicrobium escambiense]